MQGKSKKRTWIHESKRERSKWAVKASVKVVQGLLFSFHLGPTFVPRWLENHQEPVEHELHGLTINFTKMSKNKLLEHALFCLSLHCHYNKHKFLKSNTFNLTQVSK